MIEVPNIEENLSYIAPMKPSISSYSNLSEEKLQLTVRGEIGCRVYIDNMSYGTIGSSQELKVQLSNPEDSYFETFEVILTNEAGVDSLPVLFSTTFKRISID